MALEQIQNLTPDEIAALIAIDGTIAQRTEIRKVLTRLIDEFGVQPREIDRAMDHVDDTISDLVWEVENGYRHETDNA